MVLQQSYFTCFQTTCLVYQVRVTTTVNVKKLSTRLSASVLPELLENDAVIEVSHRFFVIIAVYVDCWSLVLVSSVHATTVNLCTTKICVDLSYWNHAKLNHNDSMNRPQPHVCNVEGIGCAYSEQKSLLSVFMCCRIRVDISIRM